MDKRYVILIPPDGPARAVEVMGKLTLADLQEAVGGYIEVVRTIMHWSWACEKGVETRLVVDEEGKNKGKSYNEAASKIAAIDYERDCIVGTAVLVGVRGEDIIGLQADDVRIILRQWFEA